MHVFQCVGTFFNVFRPVRTCLDLFGLVQTLFLLFPFIFATGGVALKTGMTLVPMRLKEFKAQELANVAWAFASMSAGYCPVMQLAASEVVQQTEEGFKESS